MKLHEFLVAYCLQRDITESSIEQYRIAVHCFEKWLGRPAELDDLTDEQMNRFLATYAQDHRPHTVQSKRRSLLVLWRAIADQHGIAEPNRVRRIKTPPTPRDVWSAEDVGRICAELQQVQGRLPVVCIKKADYYVGLVAAAWETGLRLADLMGLERSQAVESGWFCVTMHKTGLPHWCKLHPSTRAVINRTFDDFAPPRRLCWPTWGIRTPKACYKLIRLEIMAAVRAAGLTASDGPFKKLRRSSITAVELAAPGQGQYHAGHTSAITTQKWYLADGVKLNRPLPVELLI
jgi:integrase